MVCVAFSESTQGPIEPAQGGGPRPVLGDTQRAECRLVGANTGQSQKPQLLGTSWLSLKLSLFNPFPAVFVLFPSGTSASQSSVNWKNQ